MRVNHIVAMAENRVIGRKGGMPWHIPEDFKFFKKTTMNHAMIMGRKTWDSIGKALPGRLSIIVTRQKDFTPPDGVVTCDSLSSALAYCEQVQSQYGNDCFIIGGGEIYKQSMNQVDRIFLTQIHQTIDGDTFYPEVSPQEFKISNREPHLDDNIPFTFVTYERV